MFCCYYFLLLLLLFLICPQDDSFLLFHFLLYLWFWIDFISLLLRTQRSALWYSNSAIKIKHYNYILFTHKLVMIYTPPWFTLFCSWMYIRLTADRQRQLLHLRHKERVYIVCSIVSLWWFGDPFRLGAKWTVWSILLIFGRFYVHCENFTTHTQKLSWRIVWYLSHITGFQQLKDLIWITE